MDEESWHKKYDRIAFEVRAGIRLAYKSSYVFEDTYAGGYDDGSSGFGFGPNWLYQFKPKSVIRVKRRVAKSVYADFGHTITKKKRVKRYGSMSDFMREIGLDDDE